MNLLESLKSYRPFNEQEEKDQKVMIDCLASGKDFLTRDNLLAHFSASAWVVNQDHQKVLMCYHNIYKSWSWLGGHADGDSDLLHVALKEVEEESGLKARPVFEDIFSIEILTVDGHIKRGAYVPSHLHLNVTYLLEADEADALHEKPDENSGVKWFDHQEVLSAPNEEWMIEHVYKKLEERLMREGL